MTVIIEHVFGVIERALEELHEVVRGIDPTALSGPDAARLVSAFAELERLASAGKALVAARAAETNQWRSGGDRSAEHWLARKSGTTVGAAKDTLATAERLKALPATAEAVRDGRLSPTQAAIVAEAATVDPAAEQTLLDATRQASVAELRRRA